MYRIYKQKTEYTCGPASMLMALSYYVKNCPTEESIAMIAHTNEDIGTLPEKMESTLRYLGYNPIVKKNSTLIDLCTVSVRVPCIVLYQDQKDSYHYSLVIRIEDDTITLADPYLGEEVAMPLDYFIDNWIYSDGTRGWMLTLEEN